MKKLLLSLFLVPFVAGAQPYPNPAGGFSTTAVTTTFYDTNYVVLSGGTVASYDVMYRWVNGPSYGYYTNDATGYWMSNNPSLVGGSFVTYSNDNLTTYNRSSYYNIVGLYPTTPNNGSVFPLVWSRQGPSITQPTGAYTNHSVTYLAYTQVTNGMFSGYSINTGYSNTIYGIAYAGNNKYLQQSSILASSSVNDYGLGNAVLGSGYITLGTNVYQSVVVASDNCTMINEFFDNFMAACEVCYVSNSGGVSPMLGDFTCTNLGSANATMINCLNSYIDSGTSKLTVLGGSGAYWNANNGVGAGTGGSVQGTAPYVLGDTNIVDATSVEVSIYGNSNQVHNSTNVVIFGYGNLVSNSINVTLTGNGFSITGSNGTVGVGGASTKQFYH